MFINMRQCCGHWKIEKNIFFSQNDQFFTKGVEIFLKLSIRHGRGRIQKYGTQILNCKCDKNLCQMN